MASRHAIGSNDWVVAPAMSSTGGALLANDPHLGISMPSIWYINGLHCAPVTATCPYDVTGVTFPGVPGIVLGHNSRIAWGVTNVEPDVQDLVIETLDTADPTRYVGPGGTPRDFIARTERIEVKGGAPVDITVRETVHGPILNDVDDRLEGAPLMALRWTSISPDSGPDRTVESFLRLMVATDFASFREALTGFVGPSQNFVYADVDGHIGYQMPGVIPTRSDPDDRGLRPVSGSDGSGEWTGRIPFDELPSALDPEDGWIVTANNAVTDEAYPHFIGAEFDPGYRAERIIDLINDYGQDGLNVPEMSAIQNDTAPLRARDIVLALGDIRPSTPDGAIIAARIADWDGACLVDSRGCAAYMAWEYRVLRAMFDDELGPLARDYVGSTASWVALEQALADPDWAWWDDTTTPGVTETLGADRRQRDGHRRRRAASGLRGPRWLDLGTDAHGHLRGADDRHERDRTPRVVLQRRPGGGRRRRRRDRRLLLPTRAGLPRPGRSDRRAGRDGRAVHGHQPAVLPTRDGHVGPRRRPDRDHDRSVGHAVRPALHRPDRTVADRWDATAAVHACGDRRRDGGDADPRAGELGRRPA